MRPTRRYYGTPNDAVVRPTREALAWRAIVRQLWWRVAILLVAGAFAWQGFAFVTTSPGFAVRRIDVEGAVESDVAALAAASDLAGRNVFTADLAAARERLARMPWVADVALQRSLPDAVRVRVVEKKAACAVRTPGGFALLGDDGAAILTEADAAGRRLPVVEVARGDAAAAALAARTLAAVRESAPRFYESVVGVEAAAGRVVVRAEGRTPIVLAGPESADELLGWLAVEASVRERLGEVEQVDARWRDRLFVLPRGRGVPTSALRRGTRPRRSDMQRS